MLDRNRGGSYLSVLISGAGLFGVFLFLTYYLQKTLVYSPVTTGLAFLPMVAMIIVSSTTSNAVLLPRFGPKPLVPAGMLLAALGMVILAQIGVHSTYAGHILPALLVTGLGLGLIFAPSINTATLGVQPGRRRRGVGHREQLPASGRLDRHRLPEHDRDDRGHELSRGQGAHAAGGGAGRGTRLHGRVLVGGGHLRAGRHRRGHVAPAGRGLGPGGGSTGGGA